MGYSKDLSLTSRMNQDHLPLDCSGESDTKSVGVVGELRGIGANEIKKHEVCFESLDCVDGAGLETRFYTQACLKHLGQVLDTSLVLQIRLLIRSNDEDGPTISLSNLTEACILKELRDSLHDPSTVVLIVPARSDFHLGTFRTEGNQARLTARLTRIHEALQVPLKVLDRRWEKLVIGVATDHLLLVKHVRGKLLKATIGTMIDKEGVLNCSCSVCPLHHGNQHLWNPRIISNVVRGNEGSGLAVILRHSVKAYQIKKVQLQLLYSLLTPLKIHATGSKFASATRVEASRA